ncbi:MAG: GNAT family N-acetyltransferase [Desulfatibacillum sp.]|nr:GNAT family N-acetyltransferase [Desulfatibacillum sp.]
MTIRVYEENDWPRVWPILKEVFRQGETYAYSPDITEKEAHHAWIEYPAQTFVVTDDQGTILGTYYIKPNQPGLGVHVCNCGYIVSPLARSKGLATAMCLHSQDQARDMGFRAMQYNLVVSTNVGAIRLWKKLGFQVIGVLPQAFNHKKLGYVDALVLYKLLT